MDTLIYDDAMWCNMVDLVDRDVVHRSYKRTMCKLNVTERGHFVFGKMFPFITDLWKGEKGGVEDADETAFSRGVTFTPKERFQLIQDARRKYDKDIVTESQQSHTIEKKNNTFRARLRLTYLRELLKAWHGVTFDHAKLKVNEQSILQRFKSELTEEDKPYYGYFENGIEIEEIVEDLPEEGNYDLKLYIEDLIARDQGMSCLLKNAEEIINKKPTYTNEALQTATYNW